MTIIPETLSLKGFAVDDYAIAKAILKIPHAFTPEDDQQCVVCGAYPAVYKCSVCGYAICDDALHDDEACMFHNDSGSVIWCRECAPPSCFFQFDEDEEDEDEDEEEVD